MPNVKLPSVATLAIFLAVQPGAAQTIEQRFERWFGPPVGEAGQASRPSRPAEQPRPRAAAPSAASVPTPSGRPADAPAADPVPANAEEPSGSGPEARTPDDGPAAVPSETADPGAVSSADADAPPDDAPDASSSPAVGPGAAPQPGSADGRDPQDPAAQDTDPHDQDRQDTDPQDTPATVTSAVPGALEAVPTPEPRPAPEASRDPPSTPDPAPGPPAENDGSEAGVGADDETDGGDRQDTTTAGERSGSSAPSDLGSNDGAPADDPADVDETSEPDEPEPAPAYVSPENARTAPEDGAPETPDFDVTPQESVDAARAVEDARACEEELTARGAEFTVGPSLSEGQCGVLRPVSLTRTSSGMGVSPETAMLCRTALAFDIWVAEGVAPAARAELGLDAPTAVRQSSTYVCRDRASETGLSEHGRGSAIDIGAFDWEDREPIAVEDQAPGSPEDRFLAAARRAACGPFQTVIGPGTDADHADHFHLDIAARSNGSTYCR